MIKAKQQNNPQNNTCIVHQHTKSQKGVTHPSLVASNNQSLFLVHFVIIPSRDTTLSLHCPLNSAQHKLNNPFRKSVPRRKKKKRQVVQHCCPALRWVDVAAKTSFQNESGATFFVVVLSSVILLQSRKKGFAEVAPSETSASGVV